MGDEAPDEERFNRLWHEHAAAVLAYARRRVDETQADEVVAETFVVAWRRLDEIPVAARPWLFGVARRVSANLRRAERRWDALHDRLADDQRGTVLGSPAAGLAGTALDRLPQDDRELLILLAWDGLSRAEAAQALGCSRSTLAVRLYRARRRFEAALRHLAEEHDSVPTPILNSAPTAGGLR
jgi:RNA polymerase sigma-70 factor (ECF subfamily)